MAKDVRIVKIKTWENMAREFGFYENDTEVIDCLGNFVDNMEYGMPVDRIIKIEKNKYSNRWYWLLDGWDKWEITDDMIEGEIE